MAAIMRDEPAELSQSGRSISVALDHIVRHCLEKDRDSRFQSARDIAFALSEASGPTTTVTSGVHAVAAPSAGKRRVLHRRRRRCRSRRGGVSLLRRTPRAREAGGVKRVAVLPFENLGAAEDDYFADGMSDEVRAKLTSVPGLQVIARGSSTPYKKTDEDAEADRAGARRRRTC